jgi:oligopeptide/dipeptide ABC transporter ATP-binding protein
MEKLLEVKNLKTCFDQHSKMVAAVDDVSFSIDKNSVLGVVGESGCGKTMTALSITKLLPKKNCRIVSGSIEFDDKDIVKLEEKELNKIRGNKITYIFQEPTTSLNPVLSIKEQLEEVVLIHRKDIPDDQMESFLVKQLEQVGISLARQKLYSYPHQLSGGEKQRVMIAMAMIPEPELLIADEPTTALDVTIQDQILKLLNTLREKTNVAIMLISHDLNVIAQMADNIAVMYAGQIVETAKAEDLIRNPMHPYTQGLFGCLPKKQNNKLKKLNAIKGEVPKLGDYPPGCRFSPRCSKVFDKCVNMPPLFKLKGGQEARCWLCSE